MKTAPLFLLIVLITFSCKPSQSKRLTVSLNGEWQLATSAQIDVLPGSFEAVVPVPGLVDLAVPAADTVYTSDMIYWYSRESPVRRVPSKCAALKSIRPNIIPECL